jgi:D-sedoheptulose 7-phosphate isomerase
MNESPRKSITEAIDAHKKMVAELQATGMEVIAPAADAITKALQQNGKVYICGNGGSAADAQHIAAELVGRFERDRKALPAVALTTDTSLITSISNDDSFQNVFARQVEALVTKTDILWAISTSGTSANVIAAAKLARKKGACVLAFIGKANSELEQIADICLCANNESTARAQEIHQLAYHIICGLVEKNFCETPH